MDVDRCVLLNFKEEEGNTLLHLIVATENYKCLKAILRYKNYLDFREKNDAGMTSLCYACSLKEVISWHAVMHL